MSEVLDGRSALPPADYIDETRRLYDSLGYDAYRWAERTQPPPWSPITAHLPECRVMLVGSGGVYRHGQVAFHTLQVGRFESLDGFGAESKFFQLCGSGSHNGNC